MDVPPVFIDRVKDYIVSRKGLQLSYNIPFSPLEGRQNANFVGREYLLEQLQATINPGVGGAKIVEVVLYGTGSVGGPRLHYNMSTSITKTTRLYFGLMLSVNRP